MGKRLIFNLVFVVSIFSNAFSQTSIINGEKLFVGKRFQFSTEALHPEAQQIKVRSRALEFRFDMGEDYGLHYKDAEGTATPWNATIELEVVARPINGILPLETYNISVNLNKEAPEKIVQTFYTEHAYKVRYFDVTVKSMSNNLGYHPERLTIKTKDNIGYDVVDPEGNSFTIGYRFSDAIFSDEDDQGNRQVIGAEFNWFIPENTHFDRYMFCLLKLEPNLDGSVDVDWSQAAKIELDANQLERGWGGKRHLEYDMNLTEGTGYYVWKVQPIGNYYEELDYRSYGAYSNTGGNPSVYTDLYDIQTDADGKVTAYNIIGSTDLNLTIGRPTVNGHRFYYTQYEEDLNWIHNRVWTEGTRQAESVTYANGLSQVKQTQGKSFSENQVIGGQSVYDYMGRPSLQTLPAPMNQTTFGYKEDFLLSHKSTGANDPDVEYSAKDFDQAGKVYHTGVGATSPNPLVKTDGSPGKYYSEENELGDYANRVPDAEGVPYSRTLFYKDGRPYRSASPGETMSLKDGLDSKNPTYFYSQPTEEELIRVFGEEAPQKVDAFKTIVIGPNGVGTVQYTNKAGQTIATCLSYTGEIDELDNIGNEETFHVDHEMPNGKVIDQQNIATMGLSIENPAGQDVAFDYEFTNTDYNLPCSNDPNSPCDYKIEINISHSKDKTAEDKNAKYVIIYNKDNLSTCTGTTHELSCINNVKVYAPSGAEHPHDNFKNFATGMITLPQGTYFISKTVSIHNSPNGSSISFLDQQIKELKEQAAQWDATNHCLCTNISILPENGGAGELPQTCDDLLDHICDRSRTEQIDLLADRLINAYDLQFNEIELNFEQKTYQQLLDVSLTSALKKSDMVMKINNNYGVLPTDNPDVLDDNLEKCYQVFGAYAEAYNSLEYNLSSAMVENAFKLTLHETDASVLENSLGKTTYDPTLDFLAYYDQIIVEMTTAYTEIIKEDYDPTQDYIYNNTISNSGVVTDNGSSYTLLIADPIIDYDALQTADAVDKDAWVLGINYNRCATQFFDFDASTGVGTLKVDGFSYNEAVKAVKQCVAQNSIDINTDSYFNGGLANEVIDARAASTLAMKKQIAKCKTFCEEKRTGAFVFAIDKYIKDYNNNNGVLSIHNETDWKTFEELRLEGNGPFGVDTKECLINSLESNCENKCEQPLQLQFLEEEKQVDPVTQIPTETDEQYVLRLKNSYINNDAYNEGVLLEQQNMREAMSYAVEVAPVGTYTEGAPLEQVEQEIIDFIYEELNKGINYRLFDDPTSTCLSGECGIRRGSTTFYVKDGNITKGMTVRVISTYNNPTPSNTSLSKKEYILSGLSIKFEPIENASWDFSIFLNNSNSIENTFNIDEVYTDLKNDLFDLYFDKDHVPHLVLPNPDKWVSEYVQNIGTFLYLTDDSGEKVGARIQTFRKPALGTVDKVIKVNLKDLSTTVLTSQGTEIQVNLQSQETDGNRELLYLHDQPLTIKPEYSDLAVFAQELVNQINSSQHSSVRATNDGGELTIYFSRSSQFSSRTFNQNLYFDSDEVIFTDNTNEIAFSSYGKKDFMKEIRPINDFYKFPAFLSTTTVSQNCPVGHEEIELSNNYNSGYYPEHFQFSDNPSNSNGSGLIFVLPEAPSAPNSVPDCSFLDQTETKNKDDFKFEFDIDVSSISGSANGGIHYVNYPFISILDQNSPLSSLINISLYDATNVITNIGNSSISVALLDDQGVAIDIKNNQFHKWSVEHINGVFNIYLDGYVVYTNSDISSSFDSQYWSSVNNVYGGLGGCIGESVIIKKGCPICVRHKKPEESLNAWPVAEELVSLTCEQEKERDEKNRVAQQLNNCLLDKIEELKANYSTCIDNFSDEMKFSFDVSYHQYTLYYYNRAGTLIKTVPPQGVKFVSDPDIQLIKANRKFVQAGENGDGYVPLTDATSGDIMVPEHKLVTSYEYNSIGQHVSSTTPDGHTHRTWYNAHGQPVLSQDAQQKIDKKYSYLKYDKLGRLIESGELLDAAEELTFVAEDPNKSTDPADGLESSYTTNVESWTNINFPEDELYTRTNWSKVYYTTPTNVSYLGQSQRHLRNRISYTIRDEDGNDFTKDDKFATYYSYDPHGNVEWLLKQIPDLGKKSIAYDYDLVSGNVNKVTYQANTTEQFIHTYTYDEDNRVVDTYTSRDGITFTKEANYDYYLHGPLARTEIGDDHIQGCDYTYTIEGYLKAMNQAELDPTKDPGRDGLVNNFLKDEFGMELGYYDGDYKNEGTYLGKDGEKDPYEQAGLFTSNNSKNLYNGNISYWMANTRADQEAVVNNSHEQIGIHMNLYRYDKLNRIKKSEYKVRYNDQWISINNLGFSSAYNEQFNYDYNGNINQLTRFGRKTANGSPAYMDDLQYFYKPNSNQLLAVHDNITTDLGNEDFQSHNIGNPIPNALPNEQYQIGFNPSSVSNNYVYDEEGNLIEDKAEGLTIKWNSLNKIQEIIDSDEGETITFGYDGGGNRVTKTVVKGSDYKKTFYVRDASGMVMAVYEKQYVASENKSRLVLIEQTIYGSDRIGQFMPNLVLEEETVADPTKGLVQDAKVNLLLTNSTSYLIKQEDNSVVLDKIKDEVETGIHTTFIYQNGTPVLAAYEAGAEWNFVNGQGEVINSLTSHSSLQSTSARLIAGIKENEYYLFYSNSSFVSPSYNYVKLWYSIENNEIHTLHTGSIPNLSGNLEAVRFTDGSTRLYANGTEEYSTLYSITIDEEGVHAAHRIYEDVTLSNLSYPKQIEFSQDYSKILWSGKNSQLLEANILLGTDELVEVKQHNFAHSITDFKFSSSSDYIYTTGYENSTSKTYRYNKSSQNETSLIAGSTPYYLRRLACGDLMVYQPSGTFMHRVVNEEGTNPTVELDVVIPKGLLTRKSPNPTIETTLENHSRSLAYSSRVVGKRYYESKDHLGNVRAVIRDARRAETVTSQVYFEGMEDRRSSNNEYSYEGNYSIKLTNVLPFSEVTRIPVKSEEQLTITIQAHWQDAGANAAIVVNIVDENGTAVSGGYSKTHTTNYTLPATDQWVEMTHTANVPVNATGNLYAEVYTWNVNGTVPVWFDAEKIEVTRNENVSAVVYKDDMERQGGSSLTTDKKYSGKYSTVVYSPEQTVGRILMAPTTSDETIEISAYVKLENSNAVAELFYHYDDQNANSANGVAGIISTSTSGLDLNSTQWQLLKQTITVPTGYNINTIAVYPRSLDGADKVWFDDIQVTRIETTPLYTYETDVVSWTDYYAFGSIMPGRNVSGDYRYGFNGMEKDDEAKGEGNSYNTHFRQYDPKIGRWFSTDPVIHEWESPYVSFHNNPIYYIDPRGDNPPETPGTVEGEKKTISKQVYSSAGVGIWGGVGGYTTVTTDWYWHETSKNKEGESIGEWQNKVQYNETLKSGFSLAFVKGEGGQASYNIVDNTGSTIDENSSLYRSALTSFITSAMANGPTYASCACSPQVNVLDDDGTMIQQTHPFARGDGIYPTNTMFDIVSLGSGKFLSASVGVAIRNAVFNGTKFVIYKASRKKVTSLIVKTLVKNGFTTKTAQTFFGWGKNTVIKKTVNDFTKEQLLANGWTKSRLVELAKSFNKEGLKTIPKTGLANPASVARGNQALELARHFFGE